MRATKALAFALAFAWPLTARAQFAPQSWQSDQIAQDDSGNPHVLYFPRGGSAILPAGAASIFINDVSGTVFDAITFAGTPGSIVRISTTGSQSLILNVNTGQITINGAPFLGGSAQVVFSQPGPFGSVEEDFKGSLVGPPPSATNQITPWFYLGAMHGQPTGSPVIAAGSASDSSVPLVYDAVHKLFWFYDYGGGSWLSWGAGTGGTVTSVTGTAGQILCTPSSPNPVCSLINTGAGAGSCTNCSVTFDALGRETAYSSGTAPVTSVTATPPIFSSGGTTPVISEQGAIVSGSTSTTAQNIGAISTAPLGCVTSAGVCTVDGLTLSGGLHFNTGTGAETLDSFTCGANTFVSSSSTSGLACTQPAFSNLSGSATCAQLPALTGDVTSSAGSCATTIATKGKVLVDGADTTPDYLDVKLLTDSSTLAAQINNAGANENKKLYVVGVRDGGSLSGVGHKTTSTWGNNSLMATDGSGNWTVQSAATCGQMPALTGDVTTSAGSCATTVPAWQQAINFWVIGIIPGGWLATSQSTATFGTAIEWAYKQAFTKCRVTVNLTTNSLAGCTSSTWELSKNGSPLGGSCSVVIPCGTAGVFDSGSVSVSFSTSDLVGAETVLTGVASSGTVTGSMLILLQ